RFDGARLSIHQLAVTKAELLAASLRADKPLRAAVETTRNNVEFFSRKSLRRNWSAKNAQGAKVGEKFDPFQRVGVYIPGGTAPPARSAGAGGRHGEGKVRRRGSAGAGRARRGLRAGLAGDEFQSAAARGGAGN